MTDKEMFDFFKAQGLTDCGVAGLMGNFYAESAMRADNLQDSYEHTLGMNDTTYTAAVDSGSYNNFVKDAAWYGLAQWTYWSRKQALLNFARAKGASIGDKRMQCEFAMKELAEFPKVLNVLRRTSSVKEASEIVLTDYECPADQSENAKNTRSSYSQKYYNLYAGGTTTVEYADVQEIVTAEASIPVDESAPTATITLHQLAKGCTGAEVLSLQRLLKVAGIGRVRTNSKFDDRTHEAVIKLQKKLFPNEPTEWDGIVGAKTWAGLLTTSVGK